MLKTLNVNVLQNSNGITHDDGAKYTRGGKNLSRFGYATTLLKVAKSPPYGTVPTCRSSGLFVMAAAAATAAWAAAAAACQRRRHQLETPAFNGCQRRRVNHDRTECSPGLVPTNLARIDFTLLDVRPPAHVSSNYLFTSRAWDSLYITSQNVIFIDQQLDYNRQKRENKKKSKKQLARHHYYTQINIICCTNTY